MIAVLLALLFAVVAAVTYASPTAIGVGCLVLNGCMFLLALVRERVHA